MIGRQNRKVVSARKLNQQGVHGADLNAAPTANIARFCGVDVVLAIRLHESKGGKALHDVVARLGARKSLQQLLQHESPAEHLVSTKERIAQGENLGDLGFRVPAKRQRPNARVDKQTHDTRVRSAL